MKRVVAPTVDDKGLDAVLSEHFGRAPYFALVDIEETGKGSNIEFIPNTSEHFGGSGLPPDRIIGLKTSALITYGMGPRAIERFQEAEVAVLKADTTIMSLISLSRLHLYPFTSLSQEAGIQPFGDLPHLPQFAPTRRTPTQATGIRPNRSSRDTAPRRLHPS